jgi:uncharacterized protein with WD repeat
MKLQGQSEMNNVTWSPDGKRLSSASGDKTVRVWDAHTGSQLAQLQGHSDPVMSVNWSPDGTKLASASLDETVRVWDANTYEPIAVLQGHSSWVTSVNWSPDGTKLASASWDKTVRVWESLELLINCNNSVVYNKNNNLFKINNVLFYACKYNKPNMVTFLIDIKKEDINYKDPDGTTPLIISCINGFITIVNILIDHHVNLDLVDNNNCTALYYAVFYGNVNVVNLLISFGANINVGKSLLQSVLKNSSMDVISEIYKSKKIDIIRKIK